MAAISKQPVVFLSAGGIGGFHADDVRRGAGAFADERGWRLIVDPDAGPARMREILQCPIDGVIATLATRADCRLAAASRRPIVNLCSVMPCCPMPLVTFDNDAIGRLAAAHLIAAGFRHFAFYGISGVGFSQECECGFAEELASRGHECLRVEAPSPLATKFRALQDEQLQEWLASLPKQVGMLVATDARASLVIDACRRIGRHVPRDVGVLGVGNHRDICERSDPPLSSVNRDGFRVGWEAAAMLSRWMEGRKPAAGERRVLVPPSGISARRSTQGPLEEESLVAEVAAFLERHLGERFGVDRILREFQVSRRKLERDFRDSLGLTPALYMMRLRANAAIERARSHPEETLSMVARRSGFRDLQHMRRTLKLLGLALPESRRRRLPASDVTFPASCLAAGRGTLQRRGGGARR